MSGMSRILASLRATYDWMSALSRLGHPVIRRLDPLHPSAVIALGESFCSPESD